jgi:hypothetical protein
MTLARRYPGQDAGRRDDRAAAHAAELRHHRGNQPARGHLSDLAGALAASLMLAVERVSDAGIMTRDIGGTATTKKVTDAVIDAISASNA